MRYKRSTYEVLWQCIWSKMHKYITNVDYLQTTFAFPSDIFINVLFYGVRHFGFFWAIFVSFSSHLELKQFSHATCRTIWYQFTFKWMFKYWMCRRNSWNWNVYWLHIVSCSALDEGFPWFSASQRYYLPITFYLWKI